MGMCMCMCKCKCPTESEVQAPAPSLPGLPDRACLCLRRLANTHISVFLVHPGIVPTSLSRYYGPLSLLYAGLAAGWTKTVQAVSHTAPAV